MAVQYLSVFKPSKLFTFFQDRATLSLGTVVIQVYYNMHIPHKHTTAVKFCEHLFYRDGGSFILQCHTFP